MKISRIVDLHADAGWRGSAVPASAHEVGDRGADRATTADHHARTCSRATRMATARRLAARAPLTEDEWIKERGRRSST